MKAKSRYLSWIPWNIKDIHLVQVLRTDHIKEALKVGLADGKSPNAFLMRLKRKNWIITELIWHYKKKPINYILKFSLVLKQEL